MTRVRLSARDRVKLFEEHGGCCHLCGGKIHAGERWEVSHPIALAVGGADEPNNRRPAHFKCHRDWTAKRDAPLIAKVRRQYQKHIGAKPKRPWPKRSFAQYGRTP